MRVWRVWAARRSSLTLEMVSVVACPARSAVSADPLGGDTGRGGAFFGHAGQAASGEGPDADAVIAQSEEERQPKGNKTLIGLPTYYQAAWSDNTGLELGDASKSQKLLSWTIQFKIAAKDYRYTYGDSATSEWTSGPGGAWQELGAVADHQNDPVTQLNVVGTRTRLVDN